MTPQVCAAVRWPRRRLSFDDADGFSLRIEDDLHFAALELGYDPRDFLVKREFPFSIIRSLAQHEGLDDGAQQVRRQLAVRHYH